MGGRMSMSAEVYNGWSLLLQAVIVVAVVATFIVYYCQLQAMRAASLGQNLLAIHTFIFEESFRQDRRTLITLGENGKALADWSPEERRAAERVCAAYDLVGLTISYGVVPFKLIDDVRYSMTKCHQAAEALLNELRRKRSPDLWHHFTDIVKRFRHAHEGSGS